MALVAVHQIGVGIADQGADDEDGTDVEQQDAPEHAPDGLRNVLARVVGFGGGETHAFGALKREAGHQEHQQHRARPADEGCLRAVLGVGESPVGEAAVVIAEHAGDHQRAYRQKDQDGDDFDAGEPVLRLCVGLHGKHVERQQQDEETHGPECRAGMREPELDDQGTRHELGRQRDRPAEPVVPADRKSQRGVDEALGVGFERAADGQLSRHLAQGLHHAVDSESHDGIRQHGAPGSGLRDGAAAREEQAGADGTADGDHAELPRADAAVQFLFGGSRVDRGDDGDH